MMRPFQHVGLIALTLVLASCGNDERPAPAAAPRDTTPEWVRSPPRSAGMLYGIGQGQRGDRDAALAAARNDLVSQLQVSIDADVEHEGTSTSEESTAKARTERYQEAARTKVRARASAEELPGLTVVKQEDGERSTWLLVSLDRRVWADDLRARIATVDQKLSRDLATIDRIPGTTAAQRLSIAGRLSAWIIPGFAERDEYLRRLRLADPHLQAPAEPVDRGAITTRLADLLKDLTVEIAVGDDLRDLEPLAQQAFAKSGFRGVAVGNGTLTVPLAWSTSAQTIGTQVRIDGRLSGTIRLAAAHGGATLAAVDLTERTSAPTEAAARDRLLRKLASALAKDLDQRLLKILAGDP